MYDNVEIFGKWKKAFWWLAILSIAVFFTPYIHPSGLPDYIEGWFHYLQVAIWVSAVITVCGLSLYDPRGLIAGLWHENSVLKTQIHVFRTYCVAYEKAVTSEIDGTIQQAIVDNILKILLANKPGNKEWETLHASLYDYTALGQLLAAECRRRANENMKRLLSDSQDVDGNIPGLSRTQIIQKCANLEATASYFSPARVL
ncbi:MAG: hypothetical protein R3B53_03670 [Candidatus Paceibacterota bacterium]